MSILVCEIYEYNVVRIFFYNIRCATRHMSSKIYDVGGSQMYDTSFEAKRRFCSFSYSYRCKYTEEEGNASNRKGQDLLN